ncbi:MAG: DUF2497 domain-containing protein [Acetobacteraceae bacterium]
MTTPAQPEPTPQPGGDPSMEDILASIRRILSEEEAQAVAPEPPPSPVASDDVLVLDSSMMVQESHEAGGQPALEPTPPPVEASQLVAPAAAAAAASSVGNLVRALAADRSVQVHSGGPTIEDMVRAELRPLLKEWLDTNLPGVVERVVRAEIERVLGRAVP